MKDREKKKHSVMKYVIGFVLLAGCIAISIYSHFGGFGTGKCADTEEFSKYASSVENITIPEGTQIVALGEATHGNAEFQQLKLEVFQVLVEKYGVRAFALEGDYGGCEAVNRYIHGGDGTADQAIASVGFAIYRTKEMADLISWMRTYNETAKSGQDIKFYGFDMQRYEYNFEYLFEAAKNAEIDTDELVKIWDASKNKYTEKSTSQQREKIITSVKNKLVEKDEQQYADAIHFADILLQNMELGKHMDDTVAAIGIRDKMMADNVEWILEQEKKRENHCIFISGHNGHVKKYGCYDSDYKYMGNLLADKFENDYYVIGTDFYKSKCNLPGKKVEKRRTHTFYSHDPLAKASKKCGFAISYLDFSKISEESELKRTISSYTWMGSVGESYNLLYFILPVSYREWSSPEESYDAMIYVTDAHPTKIKSPVSLH